MNTAPFQQLQAFLGVARHRSFSGAARELGVTRSAVSQAVRQLEEQLHVVLLARTTRSVALTDSGRRLLDAAGPGLGQAVAAYFRFRDPVTLLSAPFRMSFAYADRTMAWTPEWHDASKLPFAVRMTVYDESRPAERLFVPGSPQPVPEPSVEERLAKEVRFDPDAWIVETEDRAGRHFLDLAKT